MNNGQCLNELQKALENDLQLSEVWQRTKEGKSPTKIKDELKLDRIGAISRLIKAIEKGDLPQSPSTAKQCRGGLRSFLKRHHEDFSKETIQKLEKRIKECDRRANNPQAIEDEDTKVEKETSQAVESGVAGIYVYTYPHYYRHSVVQGKDDETDDRTYLKIGMSEKDAFKRVMQQTTGMPERPRLLQIWVVENDSDLREIEKKIHDHLRTIGHSGPHQRKEWFLTNEQSVASTANLLGLKLHFELNLETDD